MTFVISSYVFIATETDDSNLSIISVVNDKKQAMIRAKNYALKIKNELNIDIEDDEEKYNIFKDGDCYVVCQMKKNNEFYHKKDYTSSQS